MDRKTIASLYADATELGGQAVAVAGWVRSIRDMKNFGFVTLNDGSFVVLRLNGVNEGAAASDEEKAAYRRFLASRAGQQDFAAYRKQLEEKADITRY